MQIWVTIYKGNSNFVWLVYPKNVKNFCTSVMYIECDNVLDSFLPLDTFRR